MDERRIDIIREVTKKGPVIYWMSRDQRVTDNWSLIYADRLAHELGSELVVAFCLAPEFLGANGDHYKFMLEGLREVEKDLMGLRVPFHFLQGDPPAQMMRLAEGLGASMVVMDHDPLRIKRKWRHALSEGTELGMAVVDSHNIVPCWIASPKQEYTAATFRPKIGRLLQEFLMDIPPRIAPRKEIKTSGTLVPDDIGGKGTAPSIIQDIELKGGEGQARKRLSAFISSGLKGYSADRNDPVIEGQSGLSPYLHFGMISAQRVALEAGMSPAPQKDKAAFLEELIVRRELSDNFCHYNERYDSYEAFPDWARKTLEEHLKDRRDYIYKVDELESATTHDPLWNAAQLQMTRTGRMHGYMRMYWGKKVLEWSETPQEALSNAIYLNDRYELDGRDPNGYAGIAWCIGGVHDRPWPSRPIFGKVRYMSIGGARGKFDVDGYIARYGP